MAKKAYIGVGGLAKKIKNGYVGVDGKARKIKTAYIGVGGVARPCWGGGEGKLEYYGVVDHLSEGRASLAATTVGGYALFGGGYASYASYDKVDAYTGSLVHSTATSLSSARKGLAATAVGGYALFGGGGDSVMPVVTVDAYTGSLVHSTAASLSEKRDSLAATAVGGYALFGGGLYKGNGARAADITAPSNTVDAYTEALVHSTATSLSEERTALAATTVGGYALFGGGVRENISSRTVDAYTGSLVRSTATSLSVARYALAATTVGGYALFGGGSADHYLGAVDAYTTSLVRSTAASLSSARKGLAATAVGSYALFGGGVCEGGITRGIDTTAYSATVDAYTESLVHSTATSLSEKRTSLATTTLGSYALFGGGTATRVTDAVDVYTAPPA